MGHEPDLAGTALNLILARPRDFRHLGQVFAKFDHIAVAIFPFVEKCKVVDDLVK